MNKNQVNVRQLVTKYQANCDRISEIAGACEKEQRSRTDAENAEFEAIVRENQLLQMKMQAAAAEHLRENPDAREQAERIIRDNAKAGRKTEIMFMRSTMVVTDVAAGGLVPLNIEDILEPLTEGFILDKVGLPFQTGLAGDFVWPVYEMVEATVLGEAAELSDTKIPFSKLQASPARVGIAIPVSNQSLNQSAGLLETIVKKIMPLSVRQLLNKIEFSTAAVNGTASSAGLVGPFVSCAQSVDLSSTPTFAELNVKMKAKVLANGIEGNHLCWVMSKAQKAILEGIPVNSSGIYVPMVQNDMLCGLPIYTTNAIRTVTKAVKKYNSSGSAWADYTIQSTDTITYKVIDDSAAHALAQIASPSNGDIAEVTVITEHIGLGDWSYQPMGLFGDLRFTVDPYSQARKDSVDFVLNCDYATKTLRPEAFVLGTVAVRS